jgi:hypothetical protein
MQPILRVAQSSVIQPCRCWDFWIAPHPRYWGLYPSRGRGWQGSLLTVETNRTLVI